MFLIVSLSSLHLLILTFIISKNILRSIGYILLLGYLKYYDEWVIKMKMLNQVLDTIAKYSFGLFFVHWYWFFIYNQIFGLEKVIPIINNNLVLVLGIVIARFFIVTVLSMLSLFVLKKLILLINKNANTRMYLGI